MEWVIGYVQILIVILLAIVFLPVDLQVSGIQFALLAFIYLELRAFRKGRK